MLGNLPFKSRHGAKIAIMSDKAQTTRNKIMGIYTTETEQIVFIDTPGIHKPKTALGDFMVESAYSTLREVETVLSWFLPMKSVVRVTT